MGIHVEIWCKSMWRRHEHFNRVMGIFWSVRRTIHPLVALLIRSMKTHRGGCNQCPNIPVNCYDHLLAFSDVRSAKYGAVYLTRLWNFWPDLVDLANSGGLAFFYGEYFEPAWVCWLRNDVFMVRASSRDRIVPGTVERQSVWGFSCGLSGVLTSTLA